MGIIEDAVSGRPSGKDIAILAVAGYFVYLAAGWAGWHSRIKALGLRARRLPTYLPFGLDFARRFARHTEEHRDLDLWHSIFDTVGGWTAEVPLAGRLMIFTADPENIKALLATQFSDYGKGEYFYAALHDFLGDSIFNTDGTIWHAHRQLLRPQFQKNRVSDLHCFESKIETLITAIANGGPLDGRPAPDLAAGDGRVLDINDLMLRYTLDVATDFLLGRDVKSLTTTKQPFADALTEVARVQGIILRMGPLSFLTPQATFREGLRVINKFVNQYIDRALSLAPGEPEAGARGDDEEEEEEREGRAAGSRGRGYTFLGAISGFTRDRTILRDQIVAVLLAGRDTTASALSWALYELANRPEAVRRLRSEILGRLGPRRAPTFADLKEMRYLQAIVAETLRLYPPLPYNMRVALRDTTLPHGGGPDGSLPVSIPKGTPVCYSVMVMHRRPDLYPRSSSSWSSTWSPSEKEAAATAEVPLPPPEEWSPERWSRWTPQSWYYLPFNGGPRFCLGQQFALTEVTYVLCRLFQRYERIESHMADGGRPTLKSEVVLQPADGVRVAFWRAKEFDE